MARRFESHAGLPAAQEHTSPSESLPGWLSGAQLVDTSGQPLPASLVDQPFGGPQIEVQERQLLGTDDAALFGSGGQKPV